MPLKKGDRRGKIETTVPRPKSESDVSGIDFKKLADDSGVTEMQAKFAYFYVFVADLNGTLAAQFAGYSAANVPDDTYSPEMKEYYQNLTWTTKAKELLDNPKVLTLLTKLREELNNQLIVDKFYVLNGLKKMHEDRSVSDNVRLNALVKLGESMELFKQVQAVEDRRDPAEIASAKFEKRKAQMVSEAGVTSNLVVFKKEG